MQRVELLPVPSRMKSYDLKTGSVYPFPYPILYPSYDGTGLYQMGYTGGNTPENAVFSDGNTRKTRGLDMYSKIQISPSP